MNNSRKLVSRWIGPALVMVVVALGWHLGSRAGDETPGTGRQHTAAGEAYRDIAGRIVRLAPEESSFTVDHEAIEGLMDAMVMDLKVADPAELRGLAPDDTILFDLVPIAGTYQAVRIRPRPGGTGAPVSEPTETRSENPLDRGDLVPDLVLINAEGERFRLREMKPRHKLITFFYTRCPLKTFCPAQSARLARLQERLEASGSSVHLVSLSLDTEHDGPEVLAGYAERFGADPVRWTLAGGETPEAVRQFADRAGARIRKHEEGFQIDHALVALRVDGDRIVDRVYGLEAIERLVREM